jgi:predicted nucleic acid-binding protein
VRLVIADTSPINYLLLIGHVDILRALFERVILPTAVWDELNHPSAPLVVRNWVASPPPWVNVLPTNPFRDAALKSLDAGEGAAIALAIDLHADLLLMDDQEGVATARVMGLNVTGTLGVLSQAAQRRLLNLAEAFDQLKRTNFRFRQEIMDEFLKEGAGQG